MQRIIGEILSNGIGARIFYDLGFWVIYRVDDLHLYLWGAIGRLFGLIFYGDV